MRVEGVVARDSQDELELAIESGQLSEALVKQGQTILKRTREPMRLAVLGAPGTGKSLLMNLLLGADAIPEGVRLPTVSLSYGDEPMTKCVLPTGETKVLPTFDPYVIAKLKPAFVEARMPLAALRKLSMMEVVTGDDMEEQARAVAWAAKRTDIALWCTVTADKLDERLWASLPPRLQDRAFLVLSKADALGAAGRLATLKEAADEMGGPYFRKVLPLATKVALSARKPDGTVDKAVMRSSGGIALITSILAEVEAGKRAAFDAVDNFLRQIDFDPEAAAATRAEKLTAAKPKTEVKTVILDEEQAQEARVLAEKMLEKVEQKKPTPSGTEGGDVVSDAPAAEPAPDLAEKPVPAPEPFPDVTQVTDDEVAEKTADKKTTVLDEAQAEVARALAEKMLKKVDAPKEPAPVSERRKSKPPSPFKGKPQKQSTERAERSDVKTVILNDTEALAARAAAERMLRKLESKSKAPIPPLTVTVHPKPETEAASEPEAAVAPSAETAVQPEAPAQPEPVAAAEPVAETEPAAQPEPVAAADDVKQAEESAEPEATAVQSDEPTMSSEARTLCTQVVEQLGAEGKALAHLLENDDLETRAVLEVSVDTVTWIAEFLDDADASDDLALKRTQAKANDAADLVQLIQLEKGDTVALDAISLMIQLKQEIEAELAA